VIFSETRLKGAYLIELEPIEDSRGSFARSFCQKEFGLHGINMNIVQCNISYNRKAGTLRGMHYQAAPYEEAKLVSCTKGAMYDVIIDLREDSATYCRWIGVELIGPGSQYTLCSEPEGKDFQPLARRMLYVPKGFAHGFLTLEDDTHVFYQMSEFYTPGQARGIRWNDPVFGIAWPGEVKVISDRDKRYPDFDAGCKGQS
jgi:dTDP-4-dehydrorhamnose 3,5-epimerase